MVIKQYIFTSAAMANMSWWAAEAIQTAFDGIAVKGGTPTAVRIIYDEVNSVYFRVALLANNDVYIKFSRSKPCVADDVYHPIIKVTG